LYRSTEITRLSLDYLHGWLVTHGDDVRVRRRSPIPVLTESDVEQLTIALLLSEVATSPIVRMKVQVSWLINLKVGGRLTLFYINQMNLVNSRNGSSLVTPNSLWRWCHDAVCTYNINHVTDRYDCNTLYMYSKQSAILCALTAYKTLLQVCFYVAIFPI